MRFRLLCFGSHLLVSFVIALLSISLVFWLWYPSPLDVALGVTNIFLLLLCVDVVVGPLLTLIIARQGKKTLKLDLLIVGILQLSALAYGLHTVAQGRPVWIIFDVDRFELVQAYEAVTDSSSSSFSALGVTGPRWGIVTDTIPESMNKRDAYYRAKFLRLYDKKATHDMTKHARPFDVLKRFNDAEIVKAVLEEYPEANAFIPLAAKEKSLSVLINKETGKTISIVNLSPW